MTKLHLLSHKTRCLIISCLTAWLLLVPCASLRGQQKASQDKTREILAEDFTKFRPKAKQKAAVSQRKRVYVMTSGVADAKQKLSSKGQIGVTVWHLRTPKKMDTGARLLLTDEREFVAQRATPERLLQPNTRVRLSIESARNGYLYVIDREVFVNGSIGPASLIFPRTKMRGGDNKVRPGQLIDIPGQVDSPNYLVASPSRRDQVGELLTILVTAKPLPVEVSDARVWISASDLAAWEKKWGAGVQRFDMQGGDGEQWTNEEKQAASPNSDQRLTDDGPPPQTLFRFPDGADEGLLISVTLRYARPRTRGRR